MSKTKILYLKHFLHFIAACGPHEVHDPCGPYPYCVPTCDNLDPDLAWCAPDCHEGCFCEPGFVRNNDWVCTSIAECPR